MKRRDMITSVTAATAVSLAGCSGSSESDFDEEITLEGRNFEPLNLQTQLGEGNTLTVLWRNDNDEDHKISSDAFTDGAKEWDLDERLGSNGGTITHTFEEPGRYEYKCGFHTEMYECGAVLIGDDVEEEPLPCE